jgi:hypothetical protein
VTMIVVKNMKGGDRSCTTWCRSSATMIKWGMPPQISLTCHQEWYMVASSSQDSMTGPCQSSPWDKSLFMASSRSTETMSACTPLTTPKPTQWPRHPPLTWTNHLSSKTLKWQWPHSKNQTSSGCPDLQHHMSHILACHHPTSTTDCIC